MDLQSDINWIKSQVDDVRDPELINTLKSLFKYRENQIKKDWWDEIEESEKSLLEESIKQLDAGEFIPHKEVLKNPRKWN